MSQVTPDNLSSRTRFSARPDSRISLVGSRMLALPYVRKLIIGAASFLLIAGCASGPLPAYEDREQPVSVEDLKILDRANLLLGDPSDWNRNDTRECHPDAPTLSLFCALQKASIEVLGSYDHRRVALQEVRFAIEEVSGGREFEHRLMDFNNLPQTTFDDIKRVLAIARSRVAARLKPATNHSFNSKPLRGSA